jgi:hypothetical protein
MRRVVEEDVGEVVEAEAWEEVAEAAVLGDVDIAARRLFRPPTIGSVPRLTLISQR